MYIFYYLLGAIGLLRCVIDQGYRRHTLERWKSTTPHQIVYEVGGGLIGFLILCGLVIWLIV